MIAADYFTKWVEAYPLVNLETVTVAEVLIREFIRRNFESAVFLEMCKLLRVTKTWTTPFHHLMVWWNALTVPLRLNSQNLLRITNKTGISRNLSQGCYSCCDIHWNSYSNSVYLE